MINPSSGIPVLHKDAAEPRMHMPPVSVDRVADCQCLQSTLVMGIPAYDCPRHFYTFLSARGFGVSKENAALFLLPRRAWFVQHL